MLAVDQRPVDVENGKAHDCIPKVRLLERHAADPAAAASVICLATDPDR